MDAVVDSAQAGPARLQLLARQSGTYSLTLVNNWQEALGSGPIQVSCDCRLPLGCSQGKILRLLPFHKANSSALCLSTRQTPLPCAVPQGKLLCLVPFHKANSSELCLSTRQTPLNCACPQGNLVCIVPFHKANSSSPACLAYHLSVLI